MKFYRFRTVRLSIIRSLFTVHSAMVYVIRVCRQLSSRTRMELHGVPSWFCSKAAWHIPFLSVQWINSWWTDELSETCRISCQNKFVKSVHLVGFITKKFVTMHGHMNVNKMRLVYQICECIDLVVELCWANGNTTDTCHNDHLLSVQRKRHPKRKSQRKCLIVKAGRLSGVQTEKIDWRLLGIKPRTGPISQFKVSQFLAVVHVVGCRVSRRV